MDIYEKLANIANELDKRELRSEANAIDNVIERLAHGNVMSPEDDWRDSFNAPTAPQNDDLFNSIFQDRRDHATMPQPIDYRRLMEELNPARMEDMKPSLMREDHSHGNKVDGPIRPFQPDDKSDELEAPSDPGLGSELDQALSAEMPLDDLSGSTYRPGGTPDLTSLIDAPRPKPAISPSQAPLVYQKNQSFPAIQRMPTIDRLV